MMMRPLLPAWLSSRSVPPRGRTPLGSVYFATSAKTWLVRPFFALRARFQCCWSQLIRNSYLHTLFLVQRISITVLWARNSNNSNFVVVAVVSVGSEGRLTLTPEQQPNAPECDQRRVPFFALTNYVEERVRIGRENPMHNFTHTLLLVQSNASSESLRTFVQQQHQI